MPKGSAEMRSISKPLPALKKSVLDKGRRRRDKATNGINGRIGKEGQKPNTWQKKGITLQKKANMIIFQKLMHS
jgi:hypothetical protein